MSTPQVGHPVRGSHAGRPIMVVLDLLGRRTALRLLWELRHGPLTFRALQQACDSNARLLNTRLAELKEAGLVDHGVGGYRLTAEGKELGTALAPLLAWAGRWGEEVLKRANESSPVAAARDAPAGPDAARGTSVVKQDAPGKAAQEVHPATGVLLG